MSLDERPPMTIDEFLDCVAASGFEWEMNSYGHIRTKILEPEDGQAMLFACPISAPFGGDANSAALGAYGDEMGLSREDTCRLAHAADNSDACAFHHLDNLRYQLLRACGLVKVQP